MTLESVWAIAAPTLLGALVLRSFGVRMRADFLSWCAWVWPCGCFALAASLWLATVCGVPSQWWAAVPLLLVVGLLLVRVSRVELLLFPSAPRPSVALQLALLLAVALFAGHAITATGYPCLVGDEANLWATKAKSLFVDWPMGEFRAAQHHTPHPDYPLLNPLLQAWIYAAEGQVTHFENRWPVMACGLSLVFAVAAAVRRLAGDSVAAVLVVALVCEPEHAHMSTTAFSDGMVGLGLVLALDGFLRERDGSRCAHRAIGALGAAFALWGKNEATMYLGIAVAAFVFDALRRRELPRLGRAAPWLALPVGLVVCQIVWNRWFDLHNDLFGEGGPQGSVPQLFVAQFSERAWPTLEAAVRAIFDPRRLHFVLALPYVALLLAPRAALSRRMFAPTCAIAGAVVVLHLIYIGSYLLLEFHLATSQLRVLFQLVPVCLVWTAAIARDLREGRA